MRRRPAYTLLEVLLAMAISVLLIAALYTAVGYQLRQAQAGRDLVEQTTLARGVFNRITTDVAATAALCDPARFRTQQAKQNSASASGSGSGSGSGQSGSNGGASSTTPGSSGGTSGGTGSSTNNSTSNNSSSSSTTTTTQTSGIVLPLGVMGDSSTLHLWTSKMPSEVWPADQNNQGALAGDVRRISYWIDSESAGGLCRYEYKVVTTQDATNITLPSGELAAYLIAPEAKSVEFTYFDGTNWQESWDSTTLGADGITPIGSPRAIAIKIGFLPTGVKASGKGTPDLKYYRHVIPITTANGNTAQTTGQPGTTSGQSGTSGTGGN
jgi:type II secretory pathway pseudopilin PulG